MTTLSVTKQITLPGVSITLDELRSVLEDAALGFVHPQVSIKVHMSANDPRERDYATLTITEGVPG